MTDEEAERLEALGDWILFAGWILAIVLLGIGAHGC